TMRSRASTEVLPQDKVGEVKRLHACLMCRNPGGEPSHNPRRSLACTHLLSCHRLNQLLVFRYAAVLGLWRTFHPARIAVGCTIARERFSSLMRICSCTP